LHAKQWFGLAKSTRFLQTANQDAKHHRVNNRPQQQTGDDNKPAATIILCDELGGIDVDNKPAQTTVALSGFYPARQLGRGARAVAGDAADETPVTFSG
jgi:hypothetical protein